MSKGKVKVRENGTQVKVYKREKLVVDAVEPEEDDNERKFMDALNDEDEAA